MGWLASNCITRSTSCIGKNCSTTYDKGVTLASEDLEGVDTVRLGADAVGLNDGQVVIVDAEDEVRVARQ